MTARSPFELRIGALVLDGFEARVRHACAQEFTTEFERLVCEHGFPEISASPRPDWRLSALSIPMDDADSPSQVGRALARGLFDALTRVAGQS